MNICLKTLLHVFVAVLRWAYLADSFKKAYGKYCSEASSGGEYGSQQSPQRRPEHADQHHEFSADFVRYNSSDNLRRGVAVIERPKDVALSLRVPVEDTVRLKRCTTFATLSCN